MICESQFQRKSIFINFKLAPDVPKVLSGYCILIDFTHIHDQYHVSRI